MRYSQILFVSTLFMIPISSLPAEENPGSATAVPLLSNQECWERLPPVSSIRPAELPNWAKAVARELPRTAAALLQLDYAQRTQSPLDPILRGKLRYVVAVQNRCQYSQAYALADLERSGLDQAAREVFQANPIPDNADVHDELEFVRLLTVAAPTVTEDHFRRLQTKHGDSGVVAMVLLAAYGNFQDRLLLGLNLPIESNGPLPPLKIKFAETAFQSTPVLPPLKEVPQPIEGGQNLIPADREWTELSFDELQRRLEEQRNKSPLIPIPRWEQVREKLPEQMRSRPTRIVWNLVGWYYAPDLSVPWSLTTRTMWAEATPDRVLEESLFWVQTRAIRCNYCMGHCEMLLEVAGLDDSQIRDRTSRLAGNDWSGFPPAEQRAYAYARKLTRTPWELTTDEYKTLAVDFGDKQAMATFFWLCRGLYMTRVSDGLKLPLEKENVFGDYRNAIRKPKE